MERSHPELTIAGTANAVRNVFAFWPKLSFLLVSVAIGFGAGSLFGVNNPDTIRALFHGSRADVTPASARLPGKPSVSAGESISIADSLPEQGGPARSVAVNEQE